MSTSEEEKKLGNEAFTNKNYGLAVEHFTKAIDMDPQNPVLYSNRSAAYAGLKKYNEALRDADIVIRLNPAWVRGHGRRATALHFLGRLREAKEEYEKVLLAEPSNANALSGLKEIEASLFRSQQPAESDEKAMHPNMFLGDVFGKLSADPATENYYKDKDFVENVNKIRSNPDAFYQLCTDKKIMMAAKVLIEQATKEKARSIQHEKEMDEGAKAAAEQEKELGNRDYKSKKFETALKHYQTAMELYPRDATYKSNMSAAYFEMNDFDKCIEICQECLNDARRLNQNNLLPKLLTRIGFAYYRKQDYDKAIEYYQKSLEEQDSEDTYNKLTKAVQAKEAAEKEGKAAVPDAKGAPGNEGGSSSSSGQKQDQEEEKKDEKEKEEKEKDDKEKEKEKEKEKGVGQQMPGGISKGQQEFQGNDPGKREEDKRNTLYRNGQYLSALEAYNTAINKDPKNASLYVSRAAVHIKLCDYVRALEDTEVAISLDPKLSKKYANYFIYIHI